MSFNLVYMNAASTGRLNVRKLSIDELLISSAAFGFANDWDRCFGDGRAPVEEESPWPGGFKFNWPDLFFKLNSAAITVSVFI